MKRIEGDQINQDKEIEKSTSIGVVLVVLARESLDGDDPMVSTVVELQSKTETERTAGQISFPAETRKVGEEEIGNLLGAVAELTDSDDVLHNLSVIPGMFYSKGSILVNGKPADVAFMIYGGPMTDSFQPVDGSEIRNNGWVSVGEVGRMNGEARPLVHDSLAFAASNGIIDSIVQNRDQMVPFSDLLEDPEFSLITFIGKRDKQSDISLSIPEGD